MAHKSQTDNPAMVAAQQIDAVMQNWRRRIAKREVGHAALRDLGISLDLPQLDVLTAIAGPQPEFLTVEGEETMVSTVAQRLGIDPSRASRLVAEMVQSGYAERAVSQADSRRTILRLTKAGQSIVDAVRGYKFLLMGDFLSEWSEEDRKQFLPLLKRFSEWSEDIDRRRESFTAEIEDLAKRVERPDADGARSA
ncbi:MarR family winged helix-turn-helix transcriptional regulator [Devosia pacifica]|uniref:MarR family winged helix-turn-helix transcriptional regulator n=1 Tax=Devosia pacifica TaxID=1335967 RepID=UPI001AEDB8F3|nr:MarR family winged helix-turn-helix transcriptional regulator [Devosia pacifica]